MEKANLVSVKGIVIPIDWDENGQILSLAIATFKEEEFLINNDHRGRDLFHFMQKPVEVTGEIKEREGRKILRVWNIHPSK